MTAASRNAVRRWGAGTAAAVRLLIASDDPLTGVTIASKVGVTQPRASQILKQLAEHGAVTATPDGYVGERARLLDLYAARARPHLVEPESHWYSTRPPTEQARLVLALAGDQDVPVTFSADLSPAEPWRDEVEGVPVADPCQQWWDLLDLGGEDRAEAADRLRTAILERTIPRVR